MTRRAVGLVGVVLALGVVLRLFVWPASSTDPGRVDAVAVLAGDQGSRFATATALMERGVASTLLVSLGARGGDSRAALRRACAAPAHYEIACFQPDPPTTRGEIHALAAIAADRGLRSLALVTSTYHLSRATALLRQCHPGPATPVASPPDGTPLQTVTLVLRECFALPAALTVQRAC